MSTAVNWLRVASDSAKNLAADLRYCDHPECRPLRHVVRLVGRRLAELRAEGREPVEDPGDELG